MVSSWDKRGTVPALVLMPRGMARAWVCPCGPFAALHGEMLELLEPAAARASSRTGCLHKPQTSKAFFSSSSSERGEENQR